LFESPRKEGVELGGFTRILLALAIIVDLIRTIQGRLLDRGADSTWPKEKLTQNIMKSITVLGILLAVLGVLALVYQGFDYTRQENVIDVGPIHATADVQKHVPLPPIVGGLALAAGAVLLAMGARQKA
jgi:hypothetical protein